MKTLLIAVTAIVLLTPPIAGAEEDRADSPHGRWIAQEIAGVVTTDGVESTLDLAPDGRASGSGGCNRIAGEAGIEGDRLSFGPLAATRMLCGDEAMDQEARFIDALGATAAWRMDDGDLFLLDAAGEVAVRFVRTGQEAVITIPVPGAEGVDAQRVTYRCGDAMVDVEYINAGPVSLAVLTVGDDFVVAANVIAASGARYAGGRYVWWSRGTDEASLEDLMADEDAAPVACTAQ